MAAKDPEPAAPEAQQSTSAPKKRKSALAQIEVDLSLPEPPSKKARRLLKKGKVLPAKPASSGDEGDKSSDDGKDGKKKQAKKDRSPHGVWIGNLPFTATKADLRKWFVDNSGGSIADDAITRVHMPTTKKPASGYQKAATENRGFAYVDFASFEANVAAIALSETELGGRKLLIKDSKSFEGRPKKEEEEEPEPGADAAAERHGNKKPANSSSTSTKIFVGNLSFNTTEDDLHAHFSKCGKIRWIKVATFEDSGKCKGYGWVNFEEPDAAAWAVKGFVKVRETVETLEDFMDEGGEGSDPKAAEAAEQDNEHDDASKASDSDEGNEDDNDDDSKPATTKDRAKPKPKATTAPPARNRTRNRKWWVNQLLGRTLKIELAEDDQTRYHKRFGKGAAKQQQQQQQQQQQPNFRKGGGPEARGKAPVDDQDTTTTATTPTRPKNKSKDREKDGQGGAIKHATDISIARRTGAAVAPQGKKVTFD